MGNATYKIDILFRDVQTLINLIDIYNPADSQNIAILSVIDMNHPRCSWKETNILQLR